MTLKYSIEKSKEDVLIIVNAMLISLMSVLMCTAFSLIVGLFFSDAIHAVLRVASPAFDGVAIWQIGATIGFIVEAVGFTRR